MRKICVITGTRAEYGLLRPSIKRLQSTPGIELQIIVTGMHLSPEFGMTMNEIVADGLDVDRNVEMLLSSDTASGISKSIGLGVIGFADAFDFLKPDAIFILGDRFEILSAAIAATVARIPIIHAHGGEVTEGVIDEPIRHSITKMAHLHFAATQEYARRIKQLGEQPDRIFVVGGFGVENIVALDLLDRKELEHQLDFKFGEKNLLTTFHPVTLEKQTSGWQTEQLLKAVDVFQDIKFIFTMPNADTEGRTISQKIVNYVENKENCIVRKSLGNKVYLSCLNQVDGVVGNSSSGLIEAPSFKIGTVNIGERQRGRIQADSVINCAPNYVEIKDAIDKLYSSEFQQVLEGVKNPYGDGQVSAKVVEILKDIDFKNLVVKKFYDWQSI